MIRNDYQLSIWKLNIHWKHGKRKMEACVVWVAWQGMGEWEKPRHRGTAIAGIVLVTNTVIVGQAKEKCEEGKRKKVAQCSWSWMLQWRFSTTAAAAHRPSISRMPSRHRRRCCCRKSLDVASWRWHGQGWRWSGR